MTRNKHAGIPGVYDMHFDTNQTVSGVSLGIVRRIEALKVGIPTKVIRTGDMK